MSSLFVFFVLVSAFACGSALHVRGSEVVPLRVGFYRDTCPNAEAIVKATIIEAAAANPRVAPLLLRLHFHDCFVEGCDASILINSGVRKPEVHAFGHLGLGGFQVIEKAKEETEAQCPGIVSCADIVAIAARDAVALAGGPIYEVETGRRDGTISDAALAFDFPEVNDPIDVLKSKFRNKGLSEQDLVLLTGGAHTIGTAACFFMKQRLFNFTGRDTANDSDPDISSSFLLPALKNMCPLNGDVNTRIPLDPVTSEQFDAQGLRNIRTNFAILASDARLYDDFTTKQVVDSYAFEELLFAQDFAMALIKMGRLAAKTGDEGEIRRVCHSFNQAVSSARATRTLTGTAQALIIMLYLGLRAFLV